LVIVRFLFYRHFMEMLTLMSFASPVMDVNDVLLFVSLSFSPVRLLLLIGWVYLCLYAVQRLQFSHLVSDRYKSIASSIGLLAGPILWLVLELKDIAEKSSEREGGVVAVLSDKFYNIKAEIKTGRFNFKKSIPKVELLDSAGRAAAAFGGKRKKAGKDWLAAQIISDALEARASDILIDPGDDDVYTIRFRIDGVLGEVEQVESDACRAVINSIKAISNMDITEKRRSQDGSFQAKVKGDSVSLRVTSAGARGGEKLSMRILNQYSDMFSLQGIGLSSKQQTIMSEFVAKPSGLILLAGPTGSGKTTTLYAMLNEIDHFTNNVIAVEDPIEYGLPNVSQIEINPKAGITFGDTLRGILRQDPDVICIGEIRDEETAGIALQAAQTGQLVLATIHSNSNASALVRLLDFGVTPLLLSTGLNSVVSQRLVRLLCEDCKEPAELTRTQLHELHKAKINCTNIFEAVGCENCNDTGYKGRTGIFDLLPLDKRIRAGLATNEALLRELRKDGDKKGKSNLQKQGLRKVVSGLTSLEELKRVIG
jgi:type II secretory ATPase GspE/PulE/Tfp pilus assembly ATPase PilB-like protein